MAHDPELQRRIADMQANQALRKMDLFGSVAVDELRACKELARRCFGDAGMLEFDEATPGLIKIGYFTGPSRAGVPGVQRPRRIMFRGFAVADLEAQARLWRSRR